ncbi:hypothetical protein FMM80_02710 [Schaedlerella arabinosiphila]|uniref:DUF4179 domain-containing protein n=1 Tax=Schaedlerella arabinosiphila TaxID=2044587 RepID=A0A9X5C4A5_9FIRM|nr:hypothetical protein [Schaedlerella arabinosiphila]NDO67695.1 hypothetical protein [Schaedlerella arabinosiphila]
MRFSEHEMKEILSKDIQISDTVNERIQHTYNMLRADQKLKSKTPRRRFSYAAAAIALTACLAVPGGVYAAANLDFFDAMFGNSTKKSTPVIETEADTGKTNADGSPLMTPVTIPSHEFVSVDPQQAEDLTGGGCMSEPVVKQLGDHTLTVDNLVYDKNGAVITFTLERAGGVTLLVGSDDTNVRKGAYLAEDRNYGFSFGTTGDIFGGENIYVDTEKSTADKMFCTAYILWNKPLSKGVFPQLTITKYPCSVKDINPGDLSEEEWSEKYAEIESKTETEDIVLTDQDVIPVQNLECITYSPISIGVNLQEGLGLSAKQAYDPGNLKYLEIKFKDGTSYVVRDVENNIANSGYSVGGAGSSETWYMTAFNRIVDINEIQEIVVNEKTFPVN